MMTSLQFPTGFARDIFDSRQVRTQPQINIPARRAEGSTASGIHTKHGNLRESTGAYVLHIYAPIAQPLLSRPLSARKEAHVAWQDHTARFHGHSNLKAINRAQTHEVTDMILTS